MKKFEYKMSNTMIKMLLKQRKDKDKKGSNQEYLCKYVNDTCGIIGTCVKVIGY